MTVHKKSFLLWVKLAIAVPVCFVVWVVLSVMLANFMAFVNAALFVAAISIFATARGRTLSARFAPEVKPVGVGVGFLFFGAIGGLLSVMAIIAPPGSARSASASASVPAAHPVAQAPAPSVSKTPRPAQSIVAPEPRCPGFEGGLPPLNERVALEIQELGPDARRPTIRARTNLPEGTVMMVSLESTNYMGQSKVPVASGCIVAGPFLDGGRDLADGRYEVEVMMPLPMVQPKAVKAKLGDGSGLKGPLVNRSGYAVTVSTVYKFQIGTNEGVRSARKARAEEEEAHTRHLKNVARRAKAMRRELAEIIRAGHDMERFRYSASPDSLRSCGKRMRQLQPRAKRLQREADALGDGSVWFAELSGAATNAQLCVSCLDSATSYCEDAETALHQFDRDMKELAD